MRESPVNVKLPQQISTSKLLLVAFFLVALVVIPIGVIQVQQQQEFRQRAQVITVQWLTSQSASTSCPAQGSGAVIQVSFKNTEPNKSSLSMNVSAVDLQTNKSVSLGNIAGGQTKTGQIQTGKTTLSSGTVKFNLKWTDGHSGTDNRTAAYKAVGNCKPPTDTPTPSPTPTNTPGPTPTGTLTPTPTPTKVPSATPTICPTLGPVKNVHIECPNCQ
jgi:hypothetical protein